MSPAERGIISVVISLFMASTTTIPFQYCSWQTKYNKNFHTNNSIGFQIWYRQGAYCELDLVRLFADIYGQGYQGLFISKFFLCVNIFHDSYILIFFFDDSNWNEITEVFALLKN